MTRGGAFRALAVAAGTGAASVAFVVAAGASPLAALWALAEAAFGNATALGETLARFTPLALTGVGAAVAFRSGVLNIGLEGQLLAGAAAAAAVGPALSGAPSGVAAATLAAAALAGALWSLPAHALAETRGVPAVLSTILLNLVAANLVAWLVRGPLRDPSGDYPQSRALSDAVRLPALVPGTRLTGAVLLAALAAVLASLVLRTTPLGLKLRAAGLSPAAARAAGLPASRLRGFAFAASGALAGLAGGLEVVALTGRLYDPFSAGVGYQGIAVGLLGGLEPLGAALAALAMGALGAGASGMQRDAGVPSAIATLVPALAVLALLLARSNPGRAEDA